jgi:hypothetical protein
VSTTALVSVGGAAVAAAAGYGLARALPGAGIAGSVGYTVVTAAAATALFLVIVDRLDPSTLRLVLHRGRSDAGSTHA